MAKRFLTIREIDDILNIIDLPIYNLPEESIQSIVNNKREQLRRQLQKCEIYPVNIPKLKKMIKKQFYGTLINPGEFVGIIAAQSVGEKQTQSTLNSLDWSEKILYVKNNKTYIEPIGQMVEKLIERNKVNIEYVEEQYKTEYVNIEDGYYIPSCDKDGGCAFYKIEGVSKHLPNGKLIKIATQSGRSMTASQGNSFLTWNGKEFVPTLGSDIKLGDIIPSTTTLNRYIKIDEYLELEQFFPGKIKLDNDFGFVIGSYLADGWVTKTFIGFSKKEDNIRQRIIDYFNKYGITQHIVYKTSRNGTRNDLKIYSVLFARLFKIICDAGSAKKCVPLFAYTAPTEFLKGLVDGYFSGDGTTISKKCGSVIADSVSEQLLIGLSFILSYFGVFGRLSNSQQTNNNIRSKNIKRCYHIHISNGFAQEFCRQFTLTNKNKQELLNQILKRKYKYVRGKSQEDFPIREIYFDEIKHIEYIDSTTEYVYDFTIEHTRNFQLFNGINCHDSFHSCGIAETTTLTGVPRFTELLGATKKPKGVTCKVPFLTNNTSLQELRKHIADNNNITEITFQDIVVSEEIIEDKKNEKWYDSFKILYNEEFTKYQHCISFKIDMHKLYEYSIDLKTVSYVLEGEFADVACVFSPPSYGQLDVFIDTANIELPEDRMLFIDNNNKYMIYMEEVVLPRLLALLINGIEGIDSIFYFNENDKWYVETNSALYSSIDKRVNTTKNTGSRFKILPFFNLLSFPGVDMKNVMTNNMWDIYTLFGIEATREFLIREFMSVMAGINICHVKLMVERMTYGGSITSISRYAMRKDGGGALGKASFEECLDNLLNAAVAGEIEPTSGVSSAIICGKLSNTGTGMCKLKMDIDRIQDKKDVQPLLKNVVENKNIKVLK